MAKGKIESRWQDKVINHNQIGGIETSVLDNGLGKGNRIAWVNTGSGLRYKIVIDRGLDIAEAFYNQYSLTWLSHAGVTSAQPQAGWEWLYRFGGGLLTTCGLTHTGPPEDDKSGDRGLHGRISNTPATVESIVQPDPTAGKLQMSITATVKQSRIFGPNLELRRTISSTIGKPNIKIKDIVTNVGNATSPHMILYHCNYGWPLVDKGTDIIWKGKWTTPDSEAGRKILNSKNNFHKCSEPLKECSGGNEACAFINITADKKGICNVGLYNSRLSLAVAMRYKKKQLPWLTNWQYWGKGEYVTGIEPGTNPPIGQAEAEKQKKLIYIAPAKSRTYEVEIKVLTEDKQISNFIKDAS